MVDVHRTISKHFTLWLLLAYVYWYFIRLAEQLSESKVKIEKAQTDIQTREADLESLTPKLQKILEVSRHY